MSKGEDRTKFVPFTCAACGQVIAERADIHLPCKPGAGGKTRAEIAHAVRLALIPMLERALAEILSNPVFSDPVEHKVQVEWLQECLGKLRPVEELVAP